jgi:YbbR domain-containing protein
MKNPLLNNWQAKLISFVIALVIWGYVKNLDDSSFFDRLLTGTLTSGR